MKKLHFKKSTLLIFVLVSCIGFSQSTYYVATTGGDSNLGTESNPFLTIDKAISSFEASGGTCFIKGGTYHEEIKLSNQNNITIKGYADEHVIIDGTVEIASSWAQSSGNPNIYETTLTQDIWQLFINNEQQVPARWPNAQFNDDSVFDQANWSPSLSSDAKGIITDTGSLNSSGINAQGTIAVANFGSYKTSVLNILTHSGNTMTYNEGELNGHATKHHYYFLEKKLELLDVENEWFYDISTKKLYVYGDPSGEKIQGKVQSYAFTMDDCSNIVFEKLNFFSTTITATTSNNITVNNCLFSYPSCSKRMIGNIKAPFTTHLGNNSKNNISNFKFYQCLFEYTDGEAIYLIGKDNTIEDCYFHHIDYSCGALSGLGVTIKNSGTNVDFKQNTIHTTGASATLDMGEKQKISYNDISKTGFLQSDGSIVQITRANVEDSNVHHNWLHDSAKSGMRYDAPISSPESAGQKGLGHHNVFWNLNKAMQIKGDVQQIYNNTCFNNESNDISILDEDYPDPLPNSNSATITRNNASDKISGHRNNPMAVPGTVDHNIYSTTSTDYGIKAKLEDPDNYDFRPKVGSELIDAGIEITGITGEFTGSAPDAGAYERTDTWKAGTTWTPDFYPWSFLTLNDNDNDDDNDGVLNNKDLCADTPAGTSVNASGCFTLSLNNFTVQVTGETCSNKKNGFIKITANETHNYKASINGINYNFTDNTFISPNLGPDTYDVCISVTNQNYEQCYTVNISAGTTTKGKASVASKKAFVEIIEGTAPFTIFINETKQFETNDTIFSVDIKQGDKLAVKTSKACEGDFSKSFDFFESIVAYPNPTRGNFEIKLPYTTLKEVTIELYTIQSLLISAKTYLIESQNVTLNIQDFSTGIYIAKIYVDRPETLKIIKQ